MWLLWPFSERPVQCLQGHPKSTAGGPSPNPNTTRPRTTVALLASPRDTSGFPLASPLGLTAQRASRRLSWRPTDGATLDSQALQADSRGCVGSKGRAGVEAAQQSTASAASRGRDRTSRSVVLWSAAIPVPTSLRCPLWPVRATRCCERCGQTMAWLARHSEALIRLPSHQRHQGSTSGQAAAASCRESAVLS